MCAVIGATLPRLVPSSEPICHPGNLTKVIEVGDAPANIKSGEEREINKQHNYICLVCQRDKGLDRRTAVKKPLSLPTCSLPPTRLLIAATLSGVWTSARIKQHIRVIRSKSTRLALSRLILGLGDQYRVKFSPRGKVRFNSDI